MLRGLEGGNTSLHPAVRMISQSRDEVFIISCIFYLAAQPVKVFKAKSFSYMLIPSLALSMEQLANNESLTQAHTVVTGQS